MEYEILESRYSASFEDRDFPIAWFWDYITSSGGIIYSQLSSSTFHLSPSHILLTLRFQSFPCHPLARPLISAVHSLCVFYVRVHDAALPFESTEAIKQSSNPESKNPIPMHSCTSWSNSRQCIAQSQYILRSHQQRHSHGSPNHTQ